MHVRTLFPTLAFVALTGCATPLTIHVVNIDDGYKPIANATVARYPTPPHRGDPWPTAAVESQTTNADGTVRFNHDTGRFLITAPGKSSASFYSPFAPPTIEVGLGNAATK